MLVVINMLAFVKINFMYNLKFSHVQVKIIFQKVIYIFL